VNIQARARTAATELKVAAEVAHLLERRGAMAAPPTSMTVSDEVALGIAAIFSSPTIHGQVLERFHRTGTADSDALIDAARFEQGYASPEGHAALYCLIGWVRAKASRVST
jgi:hypothetical protein